MRHRGIPEDYRRILKYSDTINKKIQEIQLDFCRVLVQNVQLWGSRNDRFFMRKSLEAVSLAELAFLFGMTWLAFHGSDALPERVPTHFDAAGNANAWGPAKTLWLLPAVGAGIYLLISLIALLPTSLRSAQPLSEETRARIQTLTRQMVAWLKVELITLFAFLQWFILSAVRQGSGHLTVLVVPVFLVAVFANVGWHLVAILRVARRGPAS
jgi:uncharacterized membrane protein